MQEPLSEERLSALLAAEPDLDAAWLIGSRARGQARPGSDVDVLALFSPPVPAAALAIAARPGRLADELGGALQANVDVVDVERIAPITFAIMMRDARLLLDRDRARRIDVLARQYARWHDMQPHYRLRRDAVRASFAPDGTFDVDERTAEVVDARLAHLRKRLGYLRGKAGVPRSRFLNDVTLQLAVQHAPQEAIEACLDIGRRLLVDAGQVAPNTNRDVFLALSPIGVIPASAPQKLADMAGFRNILVHGYEEVDLDRVHAALTHDLDDLERFARAVVAQLSQPPGPSA